MAKKCKLTKNGETIYPCSTMDAIVHPTLKVPSSKLIGEINVSNLFPTGGTNGTNKYTLESAITKIPTDLRIVGIKCSFLDDAGDTESWEYKGGTFTNTASWRECGGKKLAELEKKIEGLSSNAKDTEYNNALSGLRSANVQDAIDELCADYIRDFNESVESTATQGIAYISDEIDTTSLQEGDRIVISLLGDAETVLGRWGYGIIQGKINGQQSFTQIGLINYNFVDKAFDLENKYDAIRLSLQQNQVLETGNIVFNISLHDDVKSVITKKLESELNKDIRPQVVGLKEEFITESQTTRLGLDLKNGDKLYCKIKNVGTSPLYTTLYSGNEVIPQNIIINFRTISPNYVTEYIVTIDGLTEESPYVWFRTGSVDDRAEVSFILQKGLTDRTDELEVSVNKTSHAGRNGLSSYIEMPLTMLKNKIVDETNRLIFAFNGDSIIGSQLDDITKCDTYDTGEFPPNLSKKIMARMFWEKYRFSEEDVTFRNLRHPDWIRNGFNVDKSASTINFNEFEAYAPSSTSDSAEITLNVTKDSWIKLVWGYCNGGALNINITKDGSPFANDKVGNDENDTRLYQYKIYKVTSGTYKITITPDTDKYDGCRLWGCEYWSNPRLDIVVGAYSGSTATTQVKSMLNAWYGENNKPALIITDLLFINDNSLIKNGSETIAEWKKANMTLFNHAKDAGIPVICYMYHNLLVADVLRDITIPLARFIDCGKINMKFVYDNFIPLEVWVREGDGLHLNQLGNQRYFEQLDNLFADDYVDTPIPSHLIYTL